MNVLPNDIGRKSRKADINKQHIQLNKCLNEKRRREQENFYIEELAALISAGSLDEMNSLAVKPDKCAILQETVKQIQNINQQNRVDDLQASEVSSSRPNFMPNDFSSILLDALNCFLFTLNTDGYIDYISENVTKFLKYSPSELVSKSIFEILHPDDHPRFNSVLLPMAAIGNGLSSNWPSSMDQMNSSSSSSTTTTGVSTGSASLLGPSNNNSPQNNSRTFNSRFLVKAEIDISDDLDLDDEIAELNSAVYDDENNLLDTSDDNEALANDGSLLDNDLAAVLDASSVETTSAKMTNEQLLKASRRRKLLLLKKKRLKESSGSVIDLESVPQYESMQVCTRFLLNSNSDSKQLDLLGINSGSHSFSHASSSSSGSGGGNNSAHSDNGSSGSHDYQSSPEENRMMCIARRLPSNEKTIGNVLIEQFTTRLDVSGKVIGIDLSGVSSTYSQYLNKFLVNHLIHEFAHPDDMMRLQTHLREAFARTSATSPLYRFKVAHDRYVNVQTKTKVFKGNIMATHSIICDSSNNNSTSTSTSSNLTSSVSTVQSSITSVSVGSNSDHNTASTSAGGSKCNIGLITETVEQSSLTNSSSSSSSHLPQSNSSLSKSTISASAGTNVNTSSSQPQLPNKIQSSQSTINWSSANSIQSLQLQQQQQLNQMLPASIASNNLNVSNCSNITSFSPTLANTSTTSGQTITTASPLIFSSSPSFDDLGISEMFPPNSWDNFDGGGSSSHEEPTTTVDSLGLSSTNSPSLIQSNAGLARVKPFISALTVSQSFSTGSGYSLTSTVSASRPSSISTVANSSVRGGAGLMSHSQSSNFTENKKAADDKLRNLLTIGSGSGMVSCEEPDSLNNNNLNSLSSSSSGGKSRNDNILRVLLDTDDDINDISQLVGLNNNPSNELSDIINNVPNSASGCNSSSSNAGCASSAIGKGSFVDLLGDSRNVKVKSSSSSTSISSSVTASSSSNSSASNNNMLRMLLNDEDVCLKSGARNCSNDALVEQLMKEEPNHNQQQSSSSLDLNTLLSSSSEVCGVKRKNSFERDSSGNIYNFQQQDSSNDSKRLATTSTLSCASGVTTAQSSHSQQQQQSHQQHQLLACQNPMLASMLAKTPTSIPEEKIQIASSMISSTPDIKLPPNLEKKLLPGSNPPPLQHHPSTNLHSHNILSIQQQQNQNQSIQKSNAASFAQSTAGSNQQQQIQNLQLQQQLQQQHLQQQQAHLQQHHHLTTSSATAVGQQTVSGGGHHIAIKSSALAPQSSQQQQQNAPIQVRPNQQPQQQIVTNFQARALQQQQQQQVLRQQQQSLDIHHQQQQPILQPQISMSVGQQLVHHQQQQLQMKQQQIQQGQTNFLTQILTTSSGSIQNSATSQAISRARLLSPSINKQQITINVASQRPQLNSNFINSNAISSMQRQMSQQSSSQHQALMSAQSQSVANNQALANNNNNSGGIDIDSDLSQILDEVIEMQSNQDGSSSTDAVSSPGIGQSSLSSLLANTPNANRRTTDDLSSLGLSPDSQLPPLVNSPADLNERQQAISEIRKELMSIEQMTKANASSMFNSQPPRSPMLSSAPRVSHQQQSQLGPPPNYQSSVPPPPSYSSTNFTNQMNSQVSSQNFQLNRLPQSKAPPQQSAGSMMMNVPRGMVPRQQQLLRPVGVTHHIPSTVSQSGNMVGTYQLVNQSGNLSQQQMLVSGIRMTKGIGVGPQSTNQAALNNNSKQLLEQQKRLLLQQQQQQMVSQSQQPDSYSFPENMNELLNSSVAPNAQITMKPRQTASVGQDSSAQLSPRYATAVIGNTAAMQVPSTPVPVLPQSPAPGSQLSPGPGNAPTTALRIPSYSPAATSGQPHSQQNVYPSPQSNPSSASAHFTTANRMSPGHFVGPGNNVSNASASPSPAPPVSPLVQQIASPQSSGQPMPPINWQQQASPANNVRMTSAVSSPQVISPSSTSATTMSQSGSNVPATGMTQNMVSAQQKSNPMLNAQLSSGVQRFPQANRTIRLTGPPQGPRQIRSGQVTQVSQAQYSLQQSDPFGSTAGGGRGGGGSPSVQNMQQQQQLIQQQQSIQVQRAQLVSGQRMVLSRGRFAFIGQQGGQPQLVTSFNTQQSAKIGNQSIMSNPGSNDSSFGSQQSNSVQFNQSSSAQQVQMSQLDQNSMISSFDSSQQQQQQQQQFSLDGINSSTGASQMLNDRSKNASDYVKQELRTLVSGRTMQHHHQQQQSPQQSPVNPLMQQQQPPSQLGSSHSQNNVMNQNINIQSNQTQSSGQQNSSSMDQSFDLGFDFDFDDYVDLESGLDSGSHANLSTPASNNSNSNSINLGGGLSNNNMAGGQISQGSTLSRDNSIENQRPNEQHSLLQRLLSE